MATPLTIATAPQASSANLTDRVPVSQGTADAKTLTVEQVLSKSAGDATIVRTTTSVAADTAVNTPISILPGGMYNIASGKVLTLNITPIAELRQIFSGSGTVVFNAPIPVIYPEWWGALGDNNQANATTNRAAIQAALNAAATTRGGTKVQLSNGKYWVDNYLIIPDGVKVLGTGCKWFSGTVVASTSNKAIDVFRFSTNVIIKDLAVGFGLTGLNQSNGSHCLIENVEVEGCTTGIEIYNSIWNTYTHVNVTTSTLGWKLWGVNASDTYSNLNTFIACKSRYNVTGMTINRGTQNTFINFDFENNTGIALLIDGQQASPQTAFSRINSTFGSNTFYSAWFESNGAAGEPDIYIRDSQKDMFHNLRGYNLVAKTTALVDIDRASFVEFSGTIMDSTLEQKLFQIGPQSFMTDISGVESVGRTAVLDRGVNTVYRETPRQADPVHLLANQMFNVAGAGGADVFGSWSEGNATAGNATWSQDTLLLYPQTKSQFSAKLVMGAAPASAPFILQTTYGLPASTLYHAVIEYSNDTPAKINALLMINIYDSTNAMYWDFENYNWNASSKQVEIPLSSRPTFISFPFVTASSGASDVRLLIKQNTTGADGALAEHHIYSASLQPAKVPNPASDWTAAPTTGTWNVGDRIVRNPPVVSQPKAWSCTVAGTPGTWVSEGNL